MPTKNSIKLVIILSLVLFLGVGYSVVNSISLSVTGNIGSGSESIRVHFTGTPKVSNASKVTATSTAGTLTANVTVNNLVLNETVTATYYVTNNEKDVGALITSDEIINSNPDYYEVTTSVKESSILCPQNAFTNEVTVSIKLKKTPITTSDNSANISVKFNATPTTYEITECPAYT